MIDWVKYSTSFEAACVLAYFTLAFMFFFFSQGSKWIRKLAKRMGDYPAQPEIQIYLEKSLGFVLFGLIPAIIFPIIFKTQLLDYGVRLPAAEKIWLWWLVPVGLFLVISVIRPKKSVNIDYYPQVRRKKWDSRRMSVNGFFWILYLAGYEFIFRGLLFFSALFAFGLMPALAINCTVYSLTHIPKGFREAVGAIFMGILLCIIAYNTHSVLIPLVLHVILALGNDISAVAANPEMHFARRLHEEK